MSVRVMDVTVRPSTLKSQVDTWINRVWGTLSAVGARRYRQHCALAKSLDVLGDRWTLLVVRELLDGPRRYVDLLDGLVSIPTDTLANRLRALEQNELVTRRHLGPPADRVVYDLTESGETSSPSSTPTSGGAGGWSSATTPATPSVLSGSPGSSDHACALTAPASTSRWRCGRPRPP